MYMKPEEKIQYVKDRIDEETTISPKGPIWYFLYSVGHPDNPDEWTILTRGEQKRIIKKLEKEKYIKNVEFDEKKNGYWLEKIKKRTPKKAPKKTKRSNLYSYIKTSNQLLQERELFEKTLKIIGDIKPKHSYKHSTYEENDDLVQLLIDLNLIEYDWKELEKQKHREIGNRIIEFSFEADKIIELKDRVSGNKGRVQKEALELISKEIGERYTFDKIVRIFTDIGVPESMFIKDTKWRAVFYILSYYTTSNDASDNTLFLKIVERVLHPLAFDGDEEKSKETQEKYNKYLKYDNIQLKDNKAYIGPTREEWDLGIGDWVSSDGELVEPKGYAIFPNKVADLWILWGQIIILVSAYQSNKALEHKELEKLYLEMIGMVEELIDGDKLGHLKETYTRPFTSLSTADIEAKMKKAETPLDLISSFLIEITALQPDPSMISKKLEEHKDLIDRVTTATRAISGDKEIDLNAISYEQAVFLLKLISGHIFRILEVVSTGYVNVADEQLNAKYILLMDNLNNLLSREDFEEIGKSRPDILPNNLFEMIDDMDIWWSDGGGQSGMMAFIGSVETAWVRTGQQTFPMPTWLVQFFNEADNITTEHRNSKAKHWERIKENLDEEMKKNGGPFGGQAKKEEKVKKVQHEHTHRFENNIQEKDIVMNHKYTDGKPSSFYITKKDDDFYYKGLHILSSKKKTDYYKVFCTLYAQLPEGGEISYEDLISKIQSRIPKTRAKTRDEMQKFIQRNLTDKSNGFMRYAKIAETEDNGKPLISVERGSGIIFNNKTG